VVTGCVSCEEADVTFQCHFLCCCPSILRTNEKLVYSKSVDIIPAKGISRNVEVMREKYLHIITTSDPAAKFSFSIFLCVVSLKITKGDKDNACIAVCNGKHILTSF